MSWVPHSKSFSFGSESGFFLGTEVVPRVEILLKGNAFASISLGGVVVRIVVGILALESRLNAAGERG